DPANSLRQQGCQAKLADSLATLGLGTEGDAVGNHQGIQGGTIDIIYGLTGQHRVGAVGHHLLGTIVLEGIGGVAQSTGGVDDVVDKQAGAASDIADQVHHLGLVGFRAALVDDGQVTVQLLGHGAGANNAANIRGNHHQVLVVLALDVRQQHRGTVDVVNCAVKKALDLLRVKVDSEHPVDADLGKHVGHHLGADGNPHRAYPA